MNYKLLFIMIASGSLNARMHTYESVFSQWGRSLDNFYNGFDTFSESTYDSFSPSFSLEKSDTAVLVKIDTGKKVTADDISITHKNNRVTVNVTGLERTLTVQLESSRHAFAISLQSASEQEKKDQHEYQAYRGSMQQVMSVEVDLSQVVAEYSGTQLTISIPLKHEQQGKKIPVVIKDEATPVTTEQVKNKSKQHIPRDEK